MNYQTNSQIIGVSFGVIDADEIKRLSVLNVETAKTFDELNHARTGGLCDNVFGKCCTTVVMIAHDPQLTLSHLMFRSAQQARSLFFMRFV